MKTQARSLQQVDEDLRRLRAQILDSLRDSERWSVAWVRIDRLLEERAKLVEDIPRD